VKVYRVFFFGSPQGIDIKAKKAEWFGESNEQKALMLTGNGDKLVASFAPGAASSFVVVEALQ
jgi:hypothetical protein